MKQNITLIALIVLGLTTSCISVQAPSGYASTEYPGRYEFKAVSTDGNAFTLTEVRNQDKKNGTLAYWAEAMKKQLTLSRGYELKEEGEFRCGQGPGRWQQYAYKFKGTDYLYLVGVVVDGSSIYVMESAGETERFTNDLPAVKKAFETLK